MEHPKPEKYDEMARRYQKMNDRGRREELGSKETVIAFLVLLAIVAILIPFGLKFIGQGKQAAALAEARNIYLSLETVLLTGNYSDDDKAALAGRFSAFQPLILLGQGDNAVEKALMSGYQSGNPGDDDIWGKSQDDYDIKLVFDNGKLASVVVRESRSGKYETAYSENL